MPLAARLKAGLTDARVRYLTLAGFNTLVGYAVFATCYYAIGRHIGAALSLILAHAIWSPVVFLLYRRLVFGPGGTILVDFIRFQGVYLAGFTANVLFLWLATDVFGSDPYAAQAVGLALLLVGNFLGHRYISFRGSGAMGVHLGANGADK